MAPTVQCSAVEIAAKAKKPACLPAELSEVESPQGPHASMGYTHGSFKLATTKRRVLKRCATQRKEQAVQRVEHL